MDIRQKGQDLVLLIKKDRKAQVIAGAVAVCFLWLMMGEGSRRPTRRRSQPVQPTQVADKKVLQDDGYIDLVTAFNSDLQEIRQNQQNMNQSSKEIQEAMQKSQDRTTEIFQKIIGRIADLEATNATGSGGYNDPIDVSVENPGDLEVENLAPFGDLSEQEVAPPPEPEVKKIALVAAGDSVRVKLLAGVNAPTDGTPYPVIFKVLDDVIGPDGSALPIGEARIIAAAQGSLSDQRAVFRLNKMSMRLPDGSRQVVTINGWIVGEDGLRGMEGFLIDPVGKAIGAQALAGGIAGASQTLNQPNNLLINGQDGGVDFGQLSENLPERALLGGVGGAGQEWSRFIQERARLLVPHVRINSGREATAVFLDSVRIENLFDQLEQEEYAFRGLD